MRTKVAVATAAVLLALVGCGSADDDAATDPTAEAPSAEETAPTDAMPTAPEPDLEGLPDVVAVVDGVEITREEFEQVYASQLQQAFMQSQMTGQEVDQDQLKQQTAEGLVDTQLLLAEAEARSIAPTDEEVNAAAEELAASSGLGSADELFSMLEQQGLGREEAMDELRLQTSVEQLVADEAGEFTPADEDIQALYDEAAGQAGEGGELPPLEEVRPQIEAQLQQQHESEVVQALLEQLRADADITYNL
ncbi:peptidylprolyl isomerase [Georgenia sp. 311]|uniref:SurA N-terminal domain-containing protein n=1 Tax=Georgenia sp. 311 TaxID=2585134 RepID=UPI0011123002|nr:SurA N-terminal domain-containing protein [Georgenia sp. 311]TNC16670.1 peptidylprolyl isomerase [Georgenia sp. 311]